MNLVRCKNGHFYDSDHYRACPHCRAKSETMQISDNWESWDIPRIRKWDDYEEIENVDISDLFKDGNAYYPTVNSIKAYYNNARFEASFAVKPVAESREIYILGFNEKLNWESIKLQSNGIVYSALSFFKYSGPSKGEESEEKKKRRIEMIDNELESLNAFLEKKSETAGTLEDLKKLHDDYENYYECLKREQMEIIKKEDDETDEAEKTFYGIRLQLSEPVLKEAEIRISWLDNRVSWSPHFILNADSERGKVDLDCYAGLHTKIGLENVEISVSNGSEQSRIPQIRKFIISGKSVPDRNKAISGRYSCFTSSNTDHESPGTYSDEVDLDALFAPSKRAVEVELDVSEEKQMMEYRITERISMRCNEKREILISNTGFDVKKHYLMIPRDGSGAFLMMQSDEMKKRIDDEISYFKNAFVDIFLDGEFVRKQKLSSMMDQQGICLSIIDHISAKRIVLLSKTGSNVVLNRKTNRESYRIDIQNDLDHEADVMIIDNVPVSKDADIEIDVKQASGAAIDFETGIAVWKDTIQPKQIVVDYSITYPMKMEIQIDR